MIVREVRSRRRPTLARMVATTAAVSLLAVLLVDRVGPLGCTPGSVCLPVAPAALSFVVVSLLMVAAAVAPWITTADRGRVVHAKAGPRGVWFGRRLVPGASVRALSLARADRGVSLAIEDARGVWFVEVGTERDARRLASLLAPAEAPEQLPFVRPRRAFVRWALALPQLVAACAYVIAAFGTAPYDKAVPGILAVVGAQLLALATWLPPNRVLASNGGTRFDEHADLHRTPARRLPLTEDREADGARPQPADPLDRAVDESTAAWLARLDRMTAGPTREGAYRSLVADDGALWAALRDGERPVFVRVAAARLLRVAHGQDAGRIARALTDDEERVRIEAAELEGEEASARLDALGPVFRFRSR